MTSSVNCDSYYKIKAYHVDFFTTFDHSIINLKGAYYRKTDDTWMGGTTVKVVEVFTKCIITLLITSVKIILFVSIITPLVLKGISVYQNRKSYFAIQDLKKLAIAYSKAAEKYYPIGFICNSEQYDSLGNLVETHHEQESQSKIETDQGSGITYQDVIDASNKWADCLQNKAITLPESTTGAELLNFFQVELQNLVFIGTPDQIQWHQDTAGVAAAEAFKNSVIHHIRRNGNLTEDYIDYIVKSYISFMPYLKRNVKDTVRDLIRTEILSDPKIQTSVLQRAHSCHKELFACKKLQEVRQPLLDKLQIQKRKVSIIKAQITRIQSEITKTSQTIANITLTLNKVGVLTQRKFIIGTQDDNIKRREILTQNLDALFGVRDHPCTSRVFSEEIVIHAELIDYFKPVYHIVQTSDAQKVPLSLNATGDIINPGLIARLEALEQSYDSACDELLSIEDSVHIENIHCIEKSNQITARLSMLDLILEYKTKSIDLPII